ncbi:MAG: hypothetical protein V4598_09300 [Bdellovibrionota bacterium]
MIVLKNIRPLSYFRINGIVLWPFLLYADRDPHPIVMNHEQIHLEQLRREGVARFYLLYLVEYFRGRREGLTHDEAYRNISFEREAYEFQEDFFYLAGLKTGDRTSPTNNRSRGQS